MKRCLAGLVPVAASLFGTPLGAADTGPTDQRATAPLAVEVRVFEIRRLNSDFSPVEDLSFLVNTDGSSVQVSEWLATLARRIPDAYFAQLLTLGPSPAAAPAHWEIRRGDGRRGIRVRVRPISRETPPPSSAAGPQTGDGGEPPGRFLLNFALLRGDTPAQQITFQGAVEPGMTRMASGRDFEITLSRYLSWFREPGSLPAREELYDAVRDQNIYLAFGITFREAEPAPHLPVRLKPPESPRFLQLRSPLLGNAEGALRLRVHLDEEGLVAHTEILETTLPEVTPRVLGIVSGWRFPQAAGREGRLFFPVRTVRLVPSG